jgi:hypothetical protein
MHSQDHHSHPKRCSPGRPQNAPVNNGKHRSPDDNGTTEEDVWCDVPPVKEQASRQIRVFTPDASTPSSSTSVPEHCQIVVGSTPFSVPWAAPQLPATATTCVVYLTSPLQALHLLGTLPLLSFFLQSLLLSGFYCIFFTIPPRADSPVAGRGRGGEGGINLIPYLQDTSFLTDPVNPTMVMGMVLFAAEP